MDMVNMQRTGASPSLNLFWMIGPAVLDVFILFGETNVDGISVLEADGIFPRQVTALNGKST